MKNFIKKGFSLSEILIALGIVSVVAVMGFSIAKRGIDRAYDMYIYTGYKTLVDSVAYLNTKEITADNDVFFEELAKLLDTEDEGVGGSHILVNKNGVEYHFINPMITDGYFKSYEVYFVVPTSSFSIQGTIYNKIMFQLLYYYTPGGVNIIIPEHDRVYYLQNGESYSEITEEQAPDKNAMSLLNRKDLLPYYIDNGLRGRYIEGTYYPKTYYSFREAYCRSDLSFKNEITEVTQKVPSRASWNCNDINGVNSDPGSIILENPRKLRPF